MTAETDSYVWNPLVCSNCGSDRIGSVQKGIGGLPIGFCHDCSPKATLIPEEPGAKRDKAIETANKRAIGSKKAIHSVLRPLVERSQYRPKAKAVEAPMLGMFDDT